MQVSVWEKESFYAHSDVLIIGSGFVGLWSAYFLLCEDPSLRITIVDRGVIPAGASTRNAGFACFGSLTELAHDVSAMGEEQMLQLVEMRFKGLKRIRKLLPKKAFDYSTCGGYELITHKAGETPASLSEKITWLNELLETVTGRKKTFRSDDSKIKEFGFRKVDHVVENRLEGYLHSGKLCQVLLQLVQGLGVTVLPVTEVLSYEKQRDTFVAATNHGISLTADQLLVCTNAFARQLLPALDVQPARGQVLVTSPIEGLRFKGTFHFDEGFYYFRNLGNRVLLGGARNKAFQEETSYEFKTTDLIQQELERYLRECILPQSNYSIEHRWSGIMGMGAEKMPIVQELAPGIFCAVRMSGMGVALAPVVGEKISKLMRG
jgi:glycine/D-amino acid oxidase-like deaminating enzyme